MAKRKPVEGIDKLQRKLRNIEKSVQPKIVAQAARAALVPTLKEARTTAPKSSKTHRVGGKNGRGRLVAPGFLQRNIRLRKMRFRSNTRAGYSLAARKEAFYGKILERGFTHRGGFKKKTGKVTEIKSNNWLGRAYKTTESQIDYKFRRALSKRIEKAMRT